VQPTQPDASAGDERAIVVDGQTWRPGEVGIDGEGQLVQVVPCITASGEVTAGFMRIGSGILKYDNQVPRPVTKMKLVPDPEPEREPEFELMTWDWKEFPDFTDVGRTVSRLSGGKAFITEIDTGSDQMAIFVSTVPLTIKEATAMFHNDENWSNPWT